MPNRKAAYGAPPEEKEVLVTVDKRVLMAGGVLVLVLALFGGMWFARSSSSTQMSSAPNSQAAVPVATQSGLPENMPEADARATAQALGLPTSVQIVPHVESVDNLPDPFGTARAMVTPAAGTGGVSPAQSVPPGGPSGLLGDPGASPMEFTVDPNYRSKTENWTHDVLAGFPDPNLADPALVPERSELVKKPLQGPRLAVAELNDYYTYDFGVVPLDRPVSKVFSASNVGDKDLTISRVYTGCGCTALSIGNQQIDAAGYVVPPMTLKPGQAVEFTVQYDARAEGKTGPQAKYVQIYSNDPTKTLFDNADPNSGEARFRFVVEPRGKLTTPATATPATP